MHGKSINLFLMDGTPNGRIKRSIPNWTGVAYKVSRTIFTTTTNTFGPTEISYIEHRFLASLMTHTDTMFRMTIRRRLVT